MTGLKKAMCFVEDASDVFNRKRVYTNYTTQETQRFEEIRFCEEIGFPFFVIPYSEEFLPNLWIVKYKYEEPYGRMIFNVNDLSEYNILLRCCECDIRLATNIISKNGGNVEITLEDNEKVRNWPMYVSYDYTKRKMNISDLVGLESVIREYAVENNVFIKTRDKINGHGMVLGVGEILDITKKGGIISNGNWFKPRKKLVKIDLETKLIISQPITFESDAKGKLEYRGWVFNNKLMGMIRYGYPDDATDIPKEIMSLVLRFITEYSGNMPKHYVIDAGISSGNGPVIVELNPYTAAGGVTRDIFKRILDEYKESN